MKKLLIALVLPLVAACASVTKMESGTQTVSDRLVLTLDAAWNHVNAPGMGPAQVWTMEGLSLDRLLIYSGIKDGEAIHPTGGGTSRKDFTFRSGMQADQVVALFEGMLTRDGSSFKLVKLEPSAFGGEKGYRFEYTLVRRGDGVQLSGVGFGAVSRGQLFALLYQAPRMTFFSRHKDRVESIARSARVKS